MISSHLMQSLEKYTVHSRENEEKGKEHQIPSYYYKNNFDLTNSLKESLGIP